MSALRGVIRELHRRSLWQVLAIYLVLGWLLFETFEVLRVTIGLPDWVEPTAAVLLVLLLPAVIATASIQKGRPARWPRLDFRSDGVERDASRREAATPPEGDAESGAGASAEPPATPGAASPAAVRGGRSRADAPRPRPGARALLTWRNTILGGVGAFALLALVTTIYMILRSSGIGPAGTLVAQGTLDEREPLLLADFGSPRDLDELARAITEGLRVDLAQSPVVRLYDQRAVSAALIRMEREPDSRLDLHLAREVAQREAVRAVVGGEIRPVGSGFVLSARVVSADDGSVLVSRRVTARGANDVVRAVDELSKKLRERIGEPLASIGRAEPLEQVTTADLDALRRYSAAVRAIDIEGDPDRGIALLEEAVRLDSVFAMAWRKLGVALGNRAEERARSVAALARAYEHRERLTARERNLASAAYHTNVAGDYPAAIEAYERQLDRDPTDDVALNNLGSIYLELRQPARAVELFERDLAADSGQTIPLINLIFARVAMGDFDGAVAAIAAFAPWSGADPSVRQYAAHVEAARGDYAAAEAALRDLRADHPQSPFWRATTSAELATLAAVRGGLEEARRHLADATETNARRDLPRQILVDAVRLAELELWVGRDAGAALATLDGALGAHPLDAIHPLDRPSLELARVYALVARPTRARELRRRYERDVPAELRGPAARIALDRLEGALALAEGRPADAIAATRASDRGLCVPCALPQLALAYDAAGPADSAIAVRERYLATPYLWRVRDVDAWHLAATHERLARLYEERGDAARAAGHWRRLVVLWSDADEELAGRVDAARARAAELATAAGEAGR